MSAPVEGQFNNLTNSTPVESASVVLDGTENAYRVAVDDINDGAVNLMWKPAAAARFYIIQSFPGDDLGNVPTVMKTGDELKMQFVPTGGDVSEARDN